MNFEYLQQALEEKEKELQSVQENFAEFQEMSKTIESELEEEISDLKSELKKTKEENQALKEKIIDMTKNFVDKNTKLEKSFSFLSYEKESLETKLNGVTRLAREYEIELDKYKETLREKEFDVEQATSFYHKTLEDLALTCSELDTIKDSTLENIQRMKAHISELMLELATARRKSRSLSTTTAINSVRQQKTRNTVFAQGPTVGMVDNLILELASKSNQIQLP